jgi:hypothetical protein
VQDRTHSPARPAELDLLLLCSRWPQRPEDSRLIRELAALPLDWPRLLALAQHHRLVPIVSHNLHAALAAAPANGLGPEPQNPARQSVLAQLRDLAAANAIESLRSLAELRRIVHELQSHAIPARVLKGLPLAQSTFGDLSLRAAGDIDLLIDPSSILPADRILRDFGYRGLFQLDRLSPRRLAFYRAHWKDVAYIHPTTGFEIDLHWRCFRNSRMSGNALCATPAHATVSFGSFQVRTLPPSEDLLYLCVHGAFDGWLFLKSLVDVAALLRPMPASDLATLADLSATYGVLPELSAAVILVRRYLAPEIDTRGARLLPASDPTVAHILRYAALGLERGDFLAGRDAIPIASTMAFEAGLRRDLPYRRELLLRILFRARMWETLPLPDLLFPLYPLLSPIEWLLFRLRRPTPPDNEHPTT